MDLKITLYSLSFFLLFACNKQVSINQYKTVLDYYPNNSGYKFYLILPPEPCGSCKSISYELVKIIDSLNYTKAKIFFLNDTITELSIIIPLKDASKR